MIDKVSTPMVSSPEPSKSFLTRPLWGTARGLQRVGVKGWRRLQYTPLLLTRSYWGLLAALSSCRYLGCSTRAVSHASNGR